MRLRVPHPLHGLDNTLQYVGQVVGSIIPRNTKARVTSRHYKAYVILNLADHRELTVSLVQVDIDYPRGGGGTDFPALSVRSV